jgi:hypothetical protein
MQEHLRLCYVRIMSRHSWCCSPHLLACRYAENQALLGSADQLVAQQADLIRQLEGRLAAAEGAAGRSQAARIGELQQQVAALQVGCGAC